MHKKSPTRFSLSETVIFFIFYSVFSYSPSISRPHFKAFINYFRIRALLRLLLIPLFPYKCKSKIRINRKCKKIRDTCFSSQSQGFFAPGLSFSCLKIIFLCTLLLRLIILLNNPIIYLKFFCIYFTQKSKLFIFTGASDFFVKLYYFQVFIKSFIRQFPLILIYKISYQTVQFTLNSTSVTPLSFSFNLLFDCVFIIHSLHLYVNSF